MSKTPNFENSIKRLDIIVKSLENGEAPLSESIELFKEGVTLAKHCNSLLLDAQQKVSLLIKDKDGEIKEEDYKEVENI